MKRPESQICLGLEIEQTGGDLLSWEDCRPALGRGVPEWKSEAGYPERTDKRVRMWAWEFLRRNHDYRYTWDDDYGPRYNSKWEIVSGPEKKRPWRWKFGISEPLDPSIGYIEPTFQRLGPRPEPFMLNLAERFEPQIKQLKMQFEGRRIGIKRLRPDKYRDYLRLLDALDTGADFIKIGRILFPGDYGRKELYDKVSENAQQAKYFRDTAYRLLAVVERDGN